MSMTAMGPMIMMNSLKPSPAADAIMIFGGSPMSVAIPPIFEAKISAMRNGMGFSFISRVMVRSMGVRRRTVVTLSRNALVTAVTRQKSIMTSIGLPRAALAVLMAINSNNPLFRAVLTMIIIPISRKMVPKSRYSSSLSQGTMWRRTTIAAPNMAATAR